MQAMYINIVRLCLFDTLRALAADNVTHIAITDDNFNFWLVEIKAKYNVEKCKNPFLIAIAWEQNYWNQVLQINSYPYRASENESKGRHTELPQ